MRPLPFRAVIFDMDGVLVDSEPAFLEGLNVLLEPYGHRVTPEQYERIIGSSVRQTWQFVVDTFGITDATPPDLMERYEETMVALLSQPRPLLPGVEALLREVKARRLPAALCSSSRQRWVEAVLAATALDGAFDAVVWRQQAPRSKPAPDLYLKALELIDVPPERCVALEDTIPGVQAAKAAGAFTVQVRSASTALPPIDEADLVLESLEEFPLDLLAAGP